MLFGTWLRQERKRLYGSQENLAEAVGVSPQAISLLEQGKRGLPRGETLARLARALHVTTDELFQRAGLGPPPAPPDEIAEILPRLRRLRPSRAQALALHELEAHGQDLRQEERERLLQMARAILEDEERREQEAAERSVAGQGAGGQNKHFEIEAARMTTGAG